MTNARTNGPSTAQYQMLLSLLDGEKHGYGIMRCVEQLTDGQVRLGPGTLYGAIKRLIEQGWIAESDERPDPSVDDERRRYYVLTGLGQQAVQEETKRMQRLVRFANQHLFA
jgi:DNA-binding PadR family transcriptional regulator